MVDLKVGRMKSEWVYSQQVIQLEWKSKDTVLLVILTNYLSVVDLATSPARLT